MIIRGFDGNEVDAAGRGPSLTLCLSDREASASWRFIISAINGATKVRVGTIDTSPVSTGSGKNRVIAWVSCPGAVDWCVEWQLLAGPAESIATLELWANKDACTQGIVPNGSFSVVVP